VDKLADFLKELVRCYDIINRPEKTSFGQEITFWRTRYLDSLNLSSNKEDELLRTIFMYRPCEPFQYGEKTPEQVIKEIRKSTEEQLHENKPS